MTIKIMKAWMLVAAGLCLAGISTQAAAQTTELKTEYLMTYLAPLDAPAVIDGSLLIFNVKSTGTWVKGPKINGILIPPGGDWLRVLASGAMRLDVRATIKTDDGALIYMSYNGIIQHTPESAERMNKGDLLTSKDVPYFITAPTFQTSSPKYAWLNGIQAINKMVEVKLGEGGYVKYDVFVIR